MPYHQILGYHIPECLVGYLTIFVSVVGTYKDPINPFKPLNTVVVEVYKI